MFFLFVFLDTPNTRIFVMKQQSLKRQDCKLKVIKNKFRFLSTAIKIQEHRFNFATNVK